MMVMVGITSRTGAFEYITVRAYKFSKGNLWRLVIMLCMFCAVVSAFLDNVTTILLLTPVTIRICEVLNVNPAQPLIALVLYSNIGGTATAIGDPPNIIIVSYFKDTVNFGSFALHMVPGVLLTVGPVFFVINLLSRGCVTPQADMNVVREIQIWKKTAHELDRNHVEECQVRQKLESHIKELEEQVKVANAGPGKNADISELEEKYRITDMTLLIQSCLVLFVVIILFFVESFVHLGLAWIAILGAMAHLLVAGVNDIEAVLEKVEFATLFFFAALFILMECLAELGLIEFIGENVRKVVESVEPGDGRLAVAVVVILWVSAFASAFIDNIPYTAAMVSVIKKISIDSQLPLKPLIWSLAFGTCFGGNGTLIGASANVVACGLSEAAGYPITFNRFTRTGMPTMIVSIIVVTVYLLVFHVAIDWDKN
eukprot:NODE_1731_length_1317_cov_9.432177_g1441_i0.p1 GENE.NODE_1731_length_1317_cov_9.432177_g1441_i0~~NODE_1731_length_1317_cov_9.432177_g1441_i0.p1  ORF type:complete len:428 (+),score=101.94 NODE_1731_length_1317_cov_9.432177_g1441_i0:3-1286(+)